MPAQRRRTSFGMAQGALARTTTSRRPHGRPLESEDRGIVTNGADQGRVLMLRVGKDGQDDSRCSLPRCALCDMPLDQLADISEHGAPSVAESFPLQPEDPYGRFPFRGSSSRRDAAGGVEREVQIWLIAARVEEQGVFVRQGIVGNMSPVMFVCDGELIELAGGWP